MTQLIYTCSILSLETSSPKLVRPMVAYAGQNIQAYNYDTWGTRVCQSPVVERLTARI